MRLSDKLDKKTKQKLNKMREEKLSKREIEELMGVNRDTYTRRRGRVKRK